MQYQTAGNRKHNNKEGEGSRKKIKRNYIVEDMNYDLHVLYMQA